MWVKFKKHISRSKGYEADLSTNSDSSKIILKSFKKIPSSYIGFVDSDPPGSKHAPLPHQSSEPVLRLHKQLFSSFKNKKSDHYISDSCSAPSAEVDDLNGSCGTNFQSVPMGHQHSVHSPKSANLSRPKSANLSCPKTANSGSPKLTNQSCNSSPKRGCFSQVCIPNSENCRYSPVPNQQTLNCSPLAKCPDGCPKSANQVYNNNDSSKDAVDTSKCLVPNGLSRSGDETAGEYVSNHRSSVDVHEKLECQIDGSFKCITVDGTGNEVNHEIEKHVDGTGSVNMSQIDLMTTSDIVSGTRVSPPKMKRREKARPASAVEARRSHQHLGDLPLRTTNKPEVLCPVSGNCGPNISDILDDAVYCMEGGVSVGNVFCNRIEGKDAATKHDGNVVDIHDDATNGPQPKQGRRLFDCENGQSITGEDFKSEVNSNCTGPDHDTDESSGKESGYTTLEDVQLLIGQAISATKGLCNPSTEKTEQKSALGNMDFVLDEKPLDYSMKHLKSNDPTLNFDNAAEIMRHGGTVLTSQHLEDSFLSSTHSEEMFLSSTRSDDAFLTKRGPLNEFYSSKQAGFDFLLSKSFEGAISSSSRQSENLYMSSEGTSLSSRQSENLYVTSDSACKVLPAQTPSVAKQNHGFPEEACLTGVIDLSKRNCDDINYVRADGYRSHILESYLERDGLTSHGKVYASVPKSVQTSEQKNLNFIDEETLQADNFQSRSHEKIFLPDISSGEQENGNDLLEFEERSDRELEGDVGVHDGDMEYDGAVESDDGEYLPPLPTRNYVTYVNSAAVIVNPRERKFLNGTTEVNPEQTHMSWDEIMREAKSLGIPLNAPPSESLGRVSSVSSMASSQMSLASEVRSSSPLQDLAVGYPREADTGELSPPEVATQNGWSEMVPKRDGGSSRERFRLQNLFSRKSRNNERSASPTNHGIQKRCLPPVPASSVAPVFTSSHANRSAQLPASSLGKSARRTMSNMHLPTGDRGTRSVWGSSMSVPAQCLSSANGSSGSVSSLLSNISNGNAPASCSRSTHQGSFTGMECTIVPRHLLFPLP